MNEDASCREIQLGNTLYRVVSMVNKEFDWNGTLEKLAVRRAVADPLRPTEDDIPMAEGKTL